MIMQYIDELYYYETEHKLQYTDRNTGNLDLNRLLQNLSYWIEEETQVKKTKKLLIPAWAILLFSDSEQKIIIEILKRLLDEKFELYFESSNDILLLTKEHLNNLYSLKAPQYPDFTELLIKKLKYADNKILLLDDYWIQKIIDFRRPHFINAMKLLSYTEIYLDFIVDYNKQRQQKIQQIIYDKYPINPAHIEKLRKKFPESKIIIEYRQADILGQSLESDLDSATNQLAKIHPDELAQIECLRLSQIKHEDFSHLLSNHTHKLILDKCVFHNLSLSQNFVTTLTILSSKFCEMSLNSIFSNCHNLINLHLKSTGALPVRYNFPALEILSLQSVNLQKNFGEILKKTPNIKELKLIKCKNIEEELTFAIELEKLEKLKIHKAKISQKALMRLINATDILEYLT